MDRLESLIHDTRYKLELLGENIRDARNFMNDAEDKEDRILEKHNVELLEREKELLEIKLNELVEVHKQLIKGEM